MCLHCMLFVLCSWLGLLVLETKRVCLCLGLSFASWEIKRFASWHYARSFGFGTKAAMVKQFTVKGDANLFVCWHVFSLNV